MFITFEGPDGSGKSTQIRRLADHLRALGKDVLLTREPGGTPIGEQVREVLMTLKNQAMHPRTEVLLFSAARAQLVHERLRPHLAGGGWALCDRFYDSTLAYQGYGHGLDVAALRALTEFATAGLRPHLTVLFDLDPAEGLRRRQHAAGQEWNRLDAYALAFHQRVRAGYHALAAAEPDRWVVIDATPAPEAVWQTVWAHCQARLKVSA